MYEVRQHVRAMGEREKSAILSSVSRADAKNLRMERAVDAAKRFKQQPGIRVQLVALEFQDAESENPPVTFSWPVEKAPADSER